MAQNKSRHPTHKAFIVEKFGDDDSFWTEIGAVWTHEDGKGYNLSIKKGLCVSGQIVIRTVKDEALNRARTGE